MKRNFVLVIFSFVIISTFLIASKASYRRGEVDERTFQVTKEKVKSVAQRLRTLDNKPIAQRIGLYYELKKDSFEFYNFENEDELTMYGYSLLWSNQIDDAVVFFKLLTDEFPASANTYDSLGEAYLAQGNKELSLENYRRSLAMNPDNFYAEDQIARIIDPNFKEITPEEKFGKIYSPSDYRSDLDILGAKLLSTHPNALKFIDSITFFDLIEDKKDMVSESTKFAEFNSYCLEIIASINCSHTSAGSFERELSMIPKELLFPAQVQWIQDKLYVIDPLNNKEFIKSKDQILSINNQPVEKLVEKIYKVIPSQGLVETKKRHTLNSWSSILIAQALNFPETYKVRIKGKKSSIYLNKNEVALEPIFDPPFPICENNLCLEYLNNDRDAIMTIASFNYYPWNNLPEFQEFVDNAFNEFIFRGSQNLIIDLRFNGGGSPESSIHLLKYLINQPFTYLLNSSYRGAGEKYDPFPLQFQGQVYFLIDGNGNSTTGHFMSMVKKHNLGIIIGEELGSNHFCTAGQKILRLPNTRLVYYVANATSVADVNGLPDERGILPDHYVYQDLEDYLNKVDVVKNYALDLIEKTSKN